MKGSWVWYEANGLCEVQDIETMSEILNPHRLDDIKRRLLFEGETVEMAAEREGVTVEWKSAWLEEQYQFQVNSALGRVRRWVVIRSVLHELPQMQRWNVIVIFRRGPVKRFRIPG